MFAFCGNMCFDVLFGFVGKDYWIKMSPFQKARFFKG